MSIPPDALAAIAGMSLATYACRAGGFWAMGFVRITPRVQAWLEAIPIAVLSAILAPGIAEASLPEAAGFAAAFLGMRLGGNDFVGAVAGVVTVAVLRGALGSPH
jgi:branched chain amino acid efflux pump